MTRWIAVSALAAAAAVLLLWPPAISAPAPAQDNCVACHTSRAALEPLVKPFPVIPAEGEG